MDEPKYVCGGTSDIGVGREVNEDFFFMKELVPGRVVLCGVADGAGSLPSAQQPASIAVMEAVQACERMYNSDPEVFLKNSKMMLQEAMYVANRVIGAFKSANEERYAGFGASMELLLVNEDRYAFVHAGNSRLYLIRQKKDGAYNIHQMTVDHTVAARLVTEGTISEEDYYNHPDRNTLTSGVGVYNNIELQAFSGALQRGDAILITTDGIHYGIRPEYMAQFVVETGDWKAATKALVDAAKMEEVQDNGTAFVLYYYG